MNIRKLLLFISLLKYFKTDSNLSFSSMETLRNKNAAIREKLIEFISNLEVSNINKAKLTASILAMVTKPSCELTQLSTVNEKYFLFFRFKFVLKNCMLKDLVLNECQEIFDKMKGKINSLSFYDLRHLSYGLMNTLTNILNVSECVFQ